MGDGAVSAIITIGTFDGVHRGHQCLLTQVVQRARYLGLKSYAVTFDPHPRSVLYPSQPVAVLTDVQEKVDLIRQCGIDEIWVCPFTLELSHLSPEEFIHLVQERQPIEELWVGADFALGRGRAGTFAALAELGGASGWGLHMVPPYRLEGQVVASSAIRTLLAAGAVQGAAELLGRPYTVPGQLSCDGPETLFHPRPLRTLPKALTYAAQIGLRERVYDGEAIIPPIEASPLPIRVQLATSERPGSGPATLTFVRRLSA